MDFNRNGIIQFLRESDRSLVGIVKKSENLSNEAIYADVKRSLTGINGTAYFFGSRMMKLADKRSDLDIFLDIGKYFLRNDDGRLSHLPPTNLQIPDGNYYWKPLGHDTAVSCLRQIEDVLKKNSQWKVENVVIGARIPVLKAIFVPRNLKCEFCD